MNKILISVLLALGTGSALAQSGTVTTDAKVNVEATSAERTAAATNEADHFCMRETGTHLRKITRAHNDRAVECATTPGRSYSRDEIERTGSITTADALRHLDPSIH